eukprot:gb/GEZJ01000808.1/.p1 GENE.gb/GEZJ01000808.1/~~gb/GEZJ01000808.1/.p1  ORF type:complete len:707 (-),score=73.98 gb/GEZJ01000808.1/:4786-6906(-)
MSSPFTQAPAVDVSFSNISYHIPSEHSFLSRLRLAERPAAKQILHSINGYVGSSQSLAILGPSGSGKTTLLNLLAGRSNHPPSAGEVLFDGKKRVARTKRHIGYVMQDDVFFSNLTVRETLSFTAAIRVPHLSSSERESIIYKVMKRLRLLKCQDTRVGDQQFDKGISGGERKRLNIANELLHNPSILLADECTSGLDSSSAHTVITLLRELCHDGRTVIATIHQPSSNIFAMFDNIMVLAAGHVAYFGPPDRVISYFESVGFPFPSRAYNPADFVLELVIEDEIFDEDMQQMENSSTEQFVSNQQRVIDSWKRNERKLLPPLEKEARLLAKQRTKPPEGIALPMPVSEVQSAESTEEGSSSSDEKPAPSSFDHPPAPRSRIARIKRAVIKRYHDITLQHAKHNTPDKYPTDWFSQVKVLAVRSIRQKRGNVIQPMYVIHVAAVTIVCLLYWIGLEPVEASIEDRLGFLSFTSIFFAFFSTFNSLFAFPTEKQVLNKDRASGAYRLSAYYFAKSMMETPVDMLTPIVFSSIVYWVVGLNPKISAFVLYIVVLVLDVLVAQSVGLLVSALFMDIKQAQVLASMWILSSMLISGYYIDPDNTPGIVQPFRYLSFIKYSYDAMVRIEILPPRQFACIEDGPSTVYSNGGLKCPILGEDLLRAAQLSDSLSIGGSILVLITWIILLRLCGYFALKLLHTDHKPKLSTWKS